jgi:GH25 family lysozyme M1 (1,4-beta-N-acetylmuramidase)
MIFCAGLTLQLPANSQESLDSLFSPSELRNLWLESPGGAVSIKPEPFVIGLTGKPNFGGVYGVDVSHHNTDCDEPGCKCELNWDLVTQHGIRFAFLKATTGTGKYTNPDPSFRLHWKALQDLHTRKIISRGAYHWLSSKLDETGKDQAAHFLSVVSPKDAQQPPALDFEEDPAIRSEEFANQHPDYCKRAISRKTGQAYFVCDGWRDVSVQERIAKIRDWLDAVAAASRRPIIYTRSGYWNEMLGPAGAALIADYPVWLAQYPAVSAPLTWHDEHEKLPWRMPRLPKGAAYPPEGGKYSAKHFWQFTDNGKLEQSPLACNGKVMPAKFDLDWFPGLYADF